MKGKNGKGREEGEGGEVVGGERFELSLFLSL